MTGNIQQELHNKGVRHVLVEGDPGYDDSRKVWNGDIDRRPAVIVRATGAADVMDAVDAARTSGLPLAIRGGAHNVAGNGTCEGGLLIDLSLMKAILVDPAARRATVQTGCVWSEVDRETQRFGLATPGGTVSNTGVAGLTLGGGLGWLMGKHGLTIDNVLGCDVVTADGQFRRASADEEPDLFWALRGGGGNFGVVTSIDYRLHPHGPDILGGLIVHPIDHGADALRFYRNFSADMRDEAELYAGALTLPDVGPVVAFLPGYNGDVDEGLEYFKPVLEYGSPILSQVGPMPHIVRQTLIDEGNADHGHNRYWKSGLTEEISDAFIDAVVEGAKSFASPMSAILFFRIHGAATRVPIADTAFGPRHLQWDFNVLSQWTDPADTPTNKAWAHALWGKLEPLSAGTTYFNHMDAEVRAETVRKTFGANYDRLAALKARYDPDNLFRINTNIAPAVAAE